MRNAVGVSVLIVALACGALSQVAGQTLAGGAGPQPVVVLDTTSPWRMYHAMKPPVIQFDDGIKPILFEQRRLDEPTAEPPAEWRSPEFDDGGWLRGPVRLPLRSPYVARLCVRGKFMVTDPARVKGLKLAVGYHGGAIVCVNGKEVVRGHLPAQGHADLAEAYPREAYVTEQGELLSPWQMSHPYRRAKHDEESQRRIALRVRTLADIAVPQQLLRKGVNVVTIEVVRSPYHKVLDEIRPHLAEKKADWRTQGASYDLPWNTCELIQVQLTALTAGGLVPDAARPEGLQVWNSDPLAADFDAHVGDRCEPVRPIALVGARNGSFSGKVVVGSTRPIRGLAATPTDLKGDAGTIPASAVRIRYAFPWGQETSGYSHYEPAYPHHTAMLGALGESSLEEYPVRETKRNKYWGKTPGEPSPVPGAVVPVWVTVRVPADARPGTYSGRITIRADGETPVAVPVRLDVADWTLPDPQDFRTWTEVIQSPDTLAVEYGLAPWSEKHFDLIARSFGYLSETGSRVVYVPLICGTNLGNDQSMVRWTSKGDGRYEHDFSVMDRYLDLAEKHLGKPKVVAFIVWDVYLFPKSDKAERGFRARFVRDDEDPLAGKGPLVTTVNPGTGKAESAHLPLYSAPSSKAPWQALFTELRARMQRRGLADAMALGFVTDVWPTKEELVFFDEVTGRLGWVRHSHPPTRPGTKLHDVASVRYQTHVRRIYYTTDPAKGRLYGWQRPDVSAHYQRDRGFENAPTSTWRHCSEINITGSERGIGRLGGDFWSAVRDSRGRRKGQVWQRYPQSSWSNLNLYTSLLAPGPDGPVATAHLEAFREGVQECEARIFIERALTDDALKVRLGADLAGRAQEALDERLLCIWRGLCTFQLTARNDNYATRHGWGRVPGIAGHYWFLGSGWQRRSRTLYGLAAEVRKTLAAE